MPLWTLFGLRKGKATTPWPLHDGQTGQQGLFGMPRIEPERCVEECRQCADICPTGAIRLRPEGRGTERLEVDYGRCVVCQLCVDACATDAATLSDDWAFGTRDRADLVLAHTQAEGNAPPPRTARSRDEPKDAFRRSLHIRHIDSGSCNGCESELQALNNPYYNLHRLGIFFTPSPRFADLLLVTGPVTHAMHAPLLKAYEAMPEPRFVMAAGTCAISGGIAEGGYACGHGLDGILPVDLYLPGCPPNPAAVIEALLLFLDRAAQRVTGGRCVA